MNNIFNINRFGRLFIKHTAEHYKSYLMSLLVLLGLCCLAVVFMVYLINAPLDIGLQTALFTVILLLAGTIFTSTIFADFGDKKKAIACAYPAGFTFRKIPGWLVVFLLVFS